MLFKKQILLWGFSFVIVFFLGYFTSTKINNSKSNLGEDEIIRKNFNYKYINPILECNLDIKINNNLSTLKKSIINIIEDEIYKKDISFASVYYRDLNNGPWIGINEKEYFSPASLIKVPILMTYLKKAESNPEILKLELIPTISTGSGDNIQNIKPSVSLTPEKKYTVEELLEKMIIYSDNDAYNTLTNNLTSTELTKIYQDLDIDISKAFTDPNGNIITVKDYASFYRILFNASYLNQDMSEKALSILAQSQYKNGLVAGISQNISIAHKFGERKYLDSGEIQLHDCGIIYLPKKPYLLCIMTRGKDISKASQTIMFISKEVFQYLNSNSQ
jgi:beta-lactamase class A